MSADDDEVFRVTVERPNRSRAEVFGPFRTLGAARATAKRETRVEFYTGKPTGTARIERGRITWEAVDG